MFDALKAPNLPRFARITAVEVASHRRGDKSTVEYEVVTTVADTSGQLHEVSSFHRHSHFCRVHAHVKSELPAQFADDAKPLLSRPLVVSEKVKAKRLRDLSNYCALLACVGETAATPPAVRATVEGFLLRGEVPARRTSAIGANPARETDEWRSSLALPPPEEVMRIRLSTAGFASAAEQSDAAVVVQAAARAAAAATRFARKREAACTVQAAARAAAHAARARRWAAEEAAEATAAEAAAEAAEAVEARATREAAAAIEAAAAAEATAAAAAAVAAAAEPAAAPPSPVTVALRLQRAATSVQASARRRRVAFEAGIVRENATLIQAAARGRALRSPAPDRRHLRRAAAARRRRPHGLRGRHLVRPRCCRRRRRRARPHVPGPAPVATARVYRGCRRRRRRRHPRMDSAARCASGSLLHCGLAARRRLRTRRRGGGGRRRRRRRE